MKLKQGAAAVVFHHVQYCLCAKRRYWWEKIIVGHHTWCLLSQYLDSKVEDCHTFKASLGYIVSSGQPGLHCELRPARVPVCCMSPFHKTAVSSHTTEEGVCRVPRGDSVGKHSDRSSGGLQFGSQHPRRASRWSTQQLQRVGGSLLASVGTA